MRRIGDVITRVGFGLTAVALMMGATGVRLAAGTVAVAVPEIDGASVTVGLGLLGAGVLWLRARRRVK